MIPFPKMHIAESAFNRMLNMLDDNAPTNPIPQAPPVSPDPTQQSLALDATLQQTPPPVEAADPEMAQEGMLQSSVAGGSPFDGALMGA